MIIYLDLLSFLARHPPKAFPSESNSGENKTLQLYFAQILNSLPISFVYSNFD